MDYSARTMDAGLRFHPRVDIDGGDAFAPTWLRLVCCDAGTRTADTAMVRQPDRRTDRMTSALSHTRFG